MDLSEIGRQFGLNEAQTRAAFEQLAPVVAAGIRRNNQSDQGLENLLRSLQAGNHGQYAGSGLPYDQATDDGNAVLAQIFGDKDVSRGVANQAADLSGVGSAVLKKMLPVIAAIIMGQLAKKMGGGGAARAPQGGSGGGGLGDILGDILGGGASRQGQAAPQPQSGSGGGGLGDILGDILGGGAARQGQAAPQPQGGPGGGGLGDILGDILGGGAPRQGQPAPQPQGGPGGGGLGDILGDILGGGGPGTGGGRTAGQPRQQPGGVSLDDLLREMMGGGQGGGVNRDIADRSRRSIDDVLGGGTQSGNAADDLLNSVDRVTRRR